MLPTPEEQPQNSEKAQFDQALNQVANHMFVTEETK